MTLQARKKIKEEIADLGKVELTIVDENGNVRLETYTDVNDAIAAVEFEEIENTVYL